MATQRLHLYSIRNTLAAGALLVTAACDQQAATTEAPATPVAASAGQPVAGAAAGATMTASAPPAARPASSGGAPGAASSAPGQAAAAGSPGTSASGAAGSTESAPPAAASGGPDEAPSAGEPAADSGGTDPAADAGSADAAADPAMPDWSMRMDEGKGDGSDVVTIGDSWMDYVGGGGGIQAGLDRAGTNYRHYGLSATTLLSGQIPSQYTQAKNINPNILTVIMTGGGNDIMFSGGCNTAEACEESVAAIQKGLDELWTEMAADGVKDVIYIQYSADAGTAPTENRPKMTKPVPICLTGKIYCHVLPTTDLVMGDLVDGIHPTFSANDRIAKALLEMMEMRKMRR